MKYTSHCFLGLFLLFFLPFAQPAAKAQTTKTVYEPTDEVFPNPDRGLYEETEAGRGGQTQKPLDLGKLLQFRGEGLSLVTRTFYLTPFVNSDLSPGELNFIQDDFNTLRRAGMRCVLRFAYTDNYVDPDATLTVILRHLDQLGPLLRANTDVISVMQAGFIGAWGEWHHSTNGLDTNASAKRTLLDKILRILPANRMVQVRCLRYKQNIFGSQPLDRKIAFTGADAARVGFYNTAFLANWDDSGTYSLNPPYWDFNDTISAKAYLSSETKFLPMGGETDQVSQFTNKVNALAECARMHWSFLNRGYFYDVTRQWAADGTLDQMNRRLGYRFSLLDAETNPNAKAGGTLRLKIRIVNSGWGAPFNPHTVQLVLRNAVDSSEYAATLPDDPRLWAPGDTTTIEHTLGIPASMPVGPYNLLLNLSDPDPAVIKRAEYSIRLANDSMWEPRTGYNSLLRTMRVEPGSGSNTYQGIIELRPLLTTGIDRHGNGSRPDDFELGQNFPNPFNPATIISFEVYGTAFVALRLYDVLGRMVKTLVEKEMERGFYQVTLDATGLASGVYYYTMQAGASLAARKCVVLK
jgi:hypothetical protein